METIFLTRAAHGLTMELTFSATESMFSPGKINV
jgi:hypothetical protein